MTGSFYIPIYTSFPYRKVWEIRKNTHLPLPSRENHSLFLRVFRPEDFFLFPDEKEDFRGIFSYCPAMSSGNIADCILKGRHEYVFPSEIPFLTEFPDPKKIILGSEDVFHFPKPENGIFGFRKWGVEDKKLFSLNKRIPFDQEKSAECVSPLRNLHPSPAWDCTCGYYATWEKIKNCMFNEKEFVVQAIGRTILHEGGFRAERVRIVGSADDSRACEFVIEPTIEKKFIFLKEE